MPDIATISAFLTSLKTATEIAKSIKELDATVEKAELKLRLADLLSNLAEAKISASELQDLLHEKQKELDRLNEAFRLKADLVKSGDAYFLKSSSGQPSGDPFCIYCWESGGYLLHLFEKYEYLICPKCKTEYLIDNIDLPA